MQSDTTTPVDSTEGGTSRATHCATCSAPLTHTPGKRPKVYCSDRCRARARRARGVGRSSRGGRGTPTGPRLTSLDQATAEAIADRYWGKVNKLGPWSLRKGAPGPCWIWTRAKTRNGYGNFSIKGRPYGAHQVGWWLTRGPVPDGLELDHVCRVTSCVNPDHLEPVTHRENCLRGTSPFAVHARKTHCPKGHPYDEVNTWRDKEGTRRCRTCGNGWSLAGHYANHLPMPDGQRAGQCQECGSTFTAGSRGPIRRYCSPECQRTAGAQGGAA